MPILVKSKKTSGIQTANENPDVSALVGDFKKTYGEGVATKGSEVVESPRIPTGIFPLDLALGGGIPESRVTELFGSPGACKSNIAMKVVAQKQRLNPDQKCVWIDVEHCYDAKWARYMGVNTDDLVVLNPDYGEQVVDMAEALLYAPDCGLVVLDSLAALNSQAETEKSAEEFAPGSAAVMAKKLFNKCTAALRKVAHEDRTPTLVYINQIRHKIGVMYGSPETTPGGFTPVHTASLRLRCYAKQITDKKVSETIPCAKEVHVVIAKHKIPIVSTECKFEMAMIPYGHLSAGDVESWNTLFYYMKECGFVFEDGKKWGLIQPTGELFDPEKRFDTQKALREFVYGLQENVRDYEKAVVAREISRVYGGLHVIGG